MDGQSPQRPSGPEAVEHAIQSRRSIRAFLTGQALITFIDLAGHERYLKTTIAGLTGCFPDYAIVIINSLAGISKMTRYVVFFLATFC